MIQLSDRVLERVLAVTGALAVVRTERVQGLWSGYGQIVRLWLRGGSQASVIVKLVQPRAAGPQDALSHARKLRSYEVERCFYERYASRCSEHCRVARTLACESLEHAGQWLFVLEDLDASGFVERRERVPRHAARACLGWLAHFHATFMNEPAVGLWPVGTYWHLETRPDELARTRDPQLRAAAAWLDGRLREATFRTLVHGDAKLENFCFTAELTSVAAVDFQYVGAGVGVRDLAYFLSDCEDEALVDSYFELLADALARQQPDIDGAAVEAEWRALYKIACADFSRFMSGWAPGYDTRSGHSGRMTQLALSEYASMTRRSR